MSLIVNCQVPSPHVRLPVHRTWVPTFGPSSLVVMLVGGVAVVHGQLAPLPSVLVVAVVLGQLAPLIPVLEWL